MKNASNASVDKRKGRLIAGGAIAVAIVVALIVGTISASQLAKIDDGTKNFTGYELAAAKHALVHIQNQYKSEERFANWNILPKEKLQVTKVEPGTGSCAGPRKPADIGYYDVTVRQVWLFGTTSEMKWRGCILESDL